MMNTAKTKIETNGRLSDTAQCNGGAYIDDVYFISCDYYALVDDYYISAEHRYNSGLNSAYLTINRKDWKTTIWEGDLMNYILDKDPYTEYFTQDDTAKYSLFWSGTFCDTAKLNEIIRKGELELYFNKIK